MIPTSARERWSAKTPVERRALVASLRARLEAHRLALSVVIGRDELEALELAVHELEHSPLTDPMQLPRQMGGDR
jgi:acyl-CoA reductase-like NAD-dependent aldehyde dehydrogenase